MRRALQLATNGEGRVSPNPMVGAVIVADDRIIGEGFHAFFGGPHAEVNAIRSVRDSDRHLLKDSTLYVTLEPCSHHGKTPPCANLIKETGIPRVVVGSPDPNPLVAGKGIKILEEAGIEVETGILRKECDDLNRKFLLAQTSSRPWILLKWAQSADGFISPVNQEGQPYPFRFSFPLSSVGVHRLRSGMDAIMVGGNTEKTDNPRLDVRFWGGNNPKKFIAHFSLPIEKQLELMRKEGITSVMVEGGANLLSSMISKGLYDEIRIETSPVLLNNGVKAPMLPQDIRLEDTLDCRGNIIQTYRR